MTMAAPVARCAVLRTSSTCAWTVTSSAVVGSSQMMTSGSLAMAIAITTRCRMPPENSCGKAGALARGSGMPTRSSRSTALARACSLLTFWCTRTASAIWSPTR